MAAERIDMHRLQELVRLHREGMAARQRCRLLRMSPKTELKYRRALLAAGLLEGESTDLPSMEALRAAVTDAHPEPELVAESTTDVWLPRIRELLTRGVAPRAIWDKLLREEEEFDASYDAMKRTCRRLRKEQGIQAEAVVIAVDTEPGEVAQVDFGYVGRLFDPSTGMVRKAWVFVLTLGYSRKMYAHLVFDQSTATWVRLHRMAFEYLGAVPHVVVPDNLKAAVVRAAFGAADRHEVALNRTYREVARHYGFKIDPTPVRAPEKKGKVESAVRYVKRNWWPTCDAEELGDANADLQRWLEATANRRQHGTTGQVPEEVYEKTEQDRMRPLPSQRFEPVVWKVATVHPDSHVEFERRLYSVPWRLIGRKVWIRATDQSVEVYADDTRVATHERRGVERRSTNEIHLPEGRRDLRHRSESYWLERAERLGPAVLSYVRAVLESDEELSRIRDVQAIVTHLESYPPQRAHNAAVRAHAFGNMSFSAIRRILRDGLDMQPLPTFVAPAHGRLTGPRFARSATELLANLQEKDHEPN